MSTRRPAGRAPLTLTIVTLALAVLVGVPGAAKANPRAPTRPATAHHTSAHHPAAHHTVAHFAHVRPVLHHRGFADPSVIRYGGKLVAASTGRLVPRVVARSVTSRWHAQGTMLSHKPSWATSSQMWAPDLVHVRDHWLLYYSAPVAGLGPGGRCIGVAAARNPLHMFHPVGDGPLVCPRRAHTERAFDTTGRGGATVTGSGVIDPSGFQDADGTRWLLYRTQGLPATIRIVRLPGTGAGGGPHRTHGGSRQLVRADHTVENPALVRHGHHLVLVTSEGYFGGCGYQTTWRRAGHLGDFGSAPAHLLLGPGLIGVCGPGGADPIRTRDGGTTVFFNGWTCRRTCPADLDVATDQRERPKRSMYAARLAWHRGVPTVLGFLHSADRRQLREAHEHRVEMRHARRDQRARVRTRHVAHTATDALVRALSRVAPLL